MKASELIDILEEQIRQSGGDPEVRVQVDARSASRKVTAAEQGGLQDRGGFGDELSCIVLKIK